MNARTARYARRGGVVVLVAISLTVIMGLAALAVDAGMLYVARTELQASADASALAGAIELLKEGRLRGSIDMLELIHQSRVTASSFAALNKVWGQGPCVDLNESNSTGGDIIVGHLIDPTNPGAGWDFSDPLKFNAMRITVHRDDQRNGPLSLMFARVLGIDNAAVSTTATAVFEDGIVGWKITEQGDTADLLPLSLQQDYWFDLIATPATEANDQYAYDSETGMVSDGPDGVPELNIYPGSGCGQLPPGNFGTVDIGNPNNSTSDLSRQIRYGVNASDLAYYGGQLKLGPDGTIELNGDTGLSAGIKDDLEAIKGQPRAIPIFSTVAGNGNNSYFVVTGFAGIRIMHVKLTGSMKSKQVIIQPAVVVDGSGISETGGSSYYVYRPVMLTR